MFKSEYRKVNDVNVSSSGAPFLRRVVICMSIIGIIALSVAALSQTSPPSNPKEASSETSPKDEKSGYFRFNLSGALGIFRYETNWGTGDILNEIGRYQGPGIEAALELGRQRKSGFGRGREKYDFSEMEMKARLISFSLAFTVAVYWNPGRTRLPQDGGPPVLKAGTFSFPFVMRGALIECRD